MLIKSPQMIFYFSLISGTILACSSSSWILAWIGLEINLMSFVPLLIKSLTTSFMELTIKYFLIQALASMIIVFTVMASNLNLMMTMNIEITPILSIALAMKAGVAPLHFWFPQVMAYANWSQALIILTWQKIAPLILISFMYNITTPVFILSSALTGMIGGLNQTSFKKILAYSSIIHSSWLMTLAFMSDSTWWLYFVAYSFMTVSIVVPLNYMQITHINEINLLKMKFINKLLIFLTILSLAGLPPFLGFLTKMASLNLMVIYKMNPMIIIILITSSLVAFYFYSRLLYSSLLLYNCNSKLYPLSAPMENLVSSTLILSLAGNLQISFLVLLT